MISTTFWPRGEYAVVFLKVPALMQALTLLVTVPTKSDKLCSKTAYRALKVSRAMLPQAKTYLVCSFTKLLRTTELVRKCASVLHGACQLMHKLTPTSDM